MNSASASARRLLAAAGAGLLAVLVGAGPAWAHGRTASDDAYYLAAITGISPAVPGVTVRVDPHAQWVEVASTTPEPVVVLGYLREPYLRITATGVEENQRSLSTVLNRSMFAEIIPNEQNDPHAAPDWKSISGQRTARWHDHRVHWMGAQRPPVVAADPTRPHPVGTWVVHLTAGTTLVTVTGTLSWRGLPSPTAGFAHTMILVEILLVLLIGGVTVVPLVRRRRRRAGRQAGSANASAEYGVRPGSEPSRLS